MTLPEALQRLRDNYSIGGRSESQGRVGTVLNADQYNLDMFLDAMRDDTTVTITFIYGVSSQVVKDSASSYTIENEEDQLRTEIVIKREQTVEVTGRVISVKRRSDDFKVYSYEKDKYVNYDIEIEERTYYGDSCRGPGGNNRTIRKFTTHKGVLTYDGIDD